MEKYSDIHYESKIDISSHRRFLVLVAELTIEFAERLEELRGYWVQFGLKKVDRTVFINEQEVLVVIPNQMVFPLFQVLNSLGN